MEGVKELIELQRLDTELQSKKRRLAEIEALMNGNRELRQARAVLERTHTQFRKLEADQKSVEWDVDQTRDRITQVERRLMGNQVTNPRELERHYRNRYANVDVRTQRAGRAISKTTIRTGPIATAVRAGRNLKEVMTVNPEVERRWRRPERE